MTLGSLGLSLNVVRELGSLVEDAVGVLSFCESVAWFSRERKNIVKTHRRIIFLRSFRWR